MNSFDQDEFMHICKMFNQDPFSEEVAIRYANGNFFNKMKRSIENDRRGEVVFCVIRPYGKVITVTCAEYPKGIFRIPTGGINYGEDIIDAIYREVKEELGLNVEVVKFGGVLKIRFEYNEDTAMFYSYLFILKETGGRLLLDATDDEVSDVREVDLTGLEIVVDSLKSIQGKWSDWGRFRYESSNAILKILKADFKA